MGLTTQECGSRSMLILSGLPNPVVSTWQIGKSQIHIKKKSTQGTIQSKKYTKSPKKDFFLFGFIQIVKLH